MPMAMDARLIASIAAAGSLNFCGIIVETSMNVTFPTLMGEFGVGTATVQWITSGYLLTLAVLIPVFAFLRGRFDARCLFQLATGLFVIGTVTGILAPSFSVLLIARILQGAGASVGIPLMYDIVMNRVPAERVGTMMGVASLIAAVAPTIGPSLGGLMVSVATWRMIFVVLLPVVVAAFALGMYGIQVEEDCGGVTVPFDLVGFVLLSVGFVCFILGVNGAADAGWLAARTLGLFAVALVALASFGRHAGKVEHPLLSIEPLFKPAFLFGLVPVVGVQLIILGLGYLIPNFAQIVLGESALSAGTVMLPGCLVAASLSPISGRLVDRIGIKVPMLVGMVAVIAAPLLYGMSVAWASVPLMMGLHLVWGVGQGNTLGNSMNNALGSLDADVAADGNSIANTAQQLASALGTSLASCCIASAQATDGALAVTTLVGSQTAFYLLAAVGVLSLAGTLASFKFSS